MGARKGSAVKKGEISESVSTGGIEKVIRNHVGYILGRR